MGRVEVEVALANFGEIAIARNNPASAPHRKLILQGVVDTGATRLVLPAKAVHDLDLRPAGTTTVRYGDHRLAQREMVKEVWLSIMGREGIFSAIVEPGRDTVLIGAIVLEELDLLVDCGLQRLYPRDPERIVSEIG